MLDKAIGAQVDIINKTRLVKVRPDAFSELHSLAEVQGQAKSDKLGKFLESQIFHYYENCLVDREVFRTDF